MYIFLLCIQFVTKYIEKLIWELMRSYKCGKLPFKLAFLIKISKFHIAQAQLGKISCVIAFSKFTFWLSWPILDHRWSLVVIRSNIWDGKWSWLFLNVWTCKCVDTVHINRIICSVHECVNFTYDKRKRVTVYFVKKSQLFKIVHILSLTFQKAWWPWNLT